MPRGGFGAFAASVKAAKAAETGEPPSQESAAPAEAPAASKVPPAVVAAVAASLGSDAKGPKLSVEEVKKLLESLRTASMRPDFQKQLKELQQQEWGAFRKRQSFARILATAWKGAIKAAGLGINARGFPDLLAAVRKNQPDVRTLSEEVERQLKFPVGALFSAKAGYMKGASAGTSSAAAAPAFTPAPRGKAFSSNVAAAQQAQAPEPRMIAEEPPSVRGRGMGMGEAKEILKAFKEIAKEQATQNTLANLKRQGNFDKALPMLIGDLFGKTMEFFDYPNTPEGYGEMVRGVKKHGWNLHVKTAAHEVERLMHMKMGSWFTIPPDEGEEEAAQVMEEERRKKANQEPGPGEFLLVVRHAVEDKAMKVLLPKDATFSDAKDAIATKTGRQDILQKGRLVKKTGSTYSAYRDSDQIAPLTEVLVLGADLTLPGGEVEIDEGPPPIQPQEVHQPPPPRQEPAPPPRPPPPPPTPKLTRDQLLELQNQLKKGFAGEDFQRRRREFEASAIQQGLSGMKFNAERNKIYMTVQSVVLPRFGFRGDFKGVMDMMKAFEALPGDEEIAKNGYEISILLGEIPQPPPPPPQQEQPAPPPPPQPPAPAPQPPPPPPQPEKPPEEVQVTVEHALEGGSLSVTIMDNATVLDLRRLVMEKLNETKISQVKIVSRLGDGYQSVPDDRKIKDKRAFLLIGRSIDLPPEPPTAPAPATQPASPPKENKDMELTVVIDQLLGLRTSLRVAPGTTVGAVKELLAQADVSGSTRAQDFGLRLPDAEQPLDDSHQVGPGTPDLHYCNLAPADEPLANISGRWRLLDSAGMEQHSVVLIHEQSPGSETLKGWQVNVGEIWEGHIHGCDIDWKAANIQVSGKLKDQRWRMVDVWAKSDAGQRWGPFTGEWACTVEEALAQQEQKPGAEAAGTGEDIEVVIFIDRGLDLKTAVTLKSGSTAWHVKEQMANDDPTGNLQPQEIVLSLDGVVLEDSMPIAKACELEIVVAD